MITRREICFVLLFSSVSSRTVKDLNAELTPTINPEITPIQSENNILPQTLQSGAIGVVMRNFDSDEPDSNESQATKAPSYRLDLGNNDDSDDSSNQDTVEDNSSQDTTPGNENQDDVNDLDATTLYPLHEHEHKQERGDSEHTEQEEVIESQPSSENKEQENQTEHQESKPKSQDESEPVREIPQTPVEYEHSVIQELEKEQDTHNHEHKQNSLKTDLDPHANPYIENIKDKDCDEGDVIRVECNTCVCGEGKYFCSKRICQDDAKMPPKYINTNIDSNFTYVNEDMNDVFADKDADKVITSSTTTTTTTTTTPIPDCVDGRTRPIDCNQCICALGKWACTKMACIPLTLREKASFTGSDFIQRVGTLKENADMDDDCLGGETKRKGCNQCVCHQNSWACTDFKCPSTTESTVANEVQETCQTEEDVKSKECNICACRRGLWVCTSNDCKKFGNRYYHPSIRVTKPVELLEQR